MLYYALRFVHLIFMATWFGSTLFTSGDIKRTLAAGPAGVPALRERVARSSRIAGLSALLTIVTGIALIFVLGGFGSVPPPIHISLVLALAAMAIGAGGIGGAWKKIEKRIDEGADPTSLGDLAKRISMLSGIFHLLWLVTLVLMVFRASLF